MINLYTVLVKILKVLKSILKVSRLHQPGQVFLVKISENPMQFKLVFPVPGAADVVGRELSMQLNDGEPSVVVYAGSDMESAVVTCEDNAVAKGSFVDIDDAGNRSPAKEFSFTIVDTIAPPEPGDLGVVVVAD